MNQDENARILIVGGGVLALTIARELVSQGCDDIVIIEKEPELALHASGRNSGVLHAGIYYTEDSLKAKFCLSGGLKMQAYCDEHQLPLHHTGKVVVAKNAEELKTLHTLYTRATTNGAKVDLIDEKQLNDIEPWAKTHEKALYSHYTAVVDPKSIMKSLQNELVKTNKVSILCGKQFLGLRGDNVAIVNNGEIKFNFLINAAGAYADQVAHHFGIAKNLVMIPFKGIYRKLRKDQVFRVNGNIYPVPDIQNPFLGVHFTKNIHGDVTVGPTAIPAFGRENYGLLSGINAEAGSIIAKSATLFFTNQKFRQVALTEPRKYFKSYFYNCAKALVKELDKDWLENCPKAGIRPQLVNWDTKELVMDYLFEKTDRSLHLLNAISPAFTSSMAIAEHIVREHLLGKIQ